MYVNKDRKILSTHTTTVMLALIGAVTSSSVAAQESTPRRIAIIAELVVTAQRWEEAISEVSIAMQAFSTQTLKQLGVVNMRDLANVIPGFSFADSSKAFQFICSDMWKAYLKVTTKKATQALHILDRFHMMAQMSKVINTVRAGVFP